MPLPHLDLEMMRQRLRVRTYRARHAVRYRLSCIRCACDLRYLNLFGRLPGKRTPEEMIAYRVMWAVALGGLLVVLLLDAGVIDPSALYLPLDAGNQHQDVAVVRSAA